MQALGVIPSKPLTNQSKNQPLSFYKIGFSGSLVIEPLGNLLLSH